MNTETEGALGALGQLGFRGHDVYLAELIPVVEMAWADGEIQAPERTLLDACCAALIARLNRDCGAALFSLRRGRKVLERLTHHRLTPAERAAALAALKTLSTTWAKGNEMQRGILGWARTVATLEGRQAWDTRELFWLQTLRRDLGLTGAPTTAPHH